MSAAIPDSDEQVVLILVGLVASGKVEIPLKAGQPWLTLRFAIILVTYSPPSRRLSSNIFRGTRDVIRMILVIDTKWNVSFVTRCSRACLFV
jgi:hypothetical protein